MDDRQLFHVFDFSTCATFVLTLFIIVLIAYVFKRHTFGGRKARFPPGPPGLPFLGNFLQIDPKAFHIKLSEWCEQYGGVMTINLLGQKIVVLQTAEVIEKALLDSAYSDVFLGRAPSFPGNYIIPNDTIFQHLSKRGTFARKVIIRCAKNFSGKSEKNETLMDENRAYVMKIIESSDGAPFDPQKLSEHFVTRCMLSALTGLRSTHTDRVQCLVTKIGDNLNYFSNQGNSFLLDFIPLLRWLPTEVGKKYKEILADMRELNELLLTTAEKEKPNEDSMLHSFLKQKDVEVTNGRASINFTMEALRDNITDLAGAGVETPNSLFYSLIYAIAYRQDIQRRIQDEVDNAIGPDRSPSVVDKALLPFTEATVLEVLRMAPPLRLTVPYCVLDDVEFNGYFLPKCTQVFVNIWEPQNTEDFWESPHVFNPDRFLDERGEILPPSHERNKRIFAFGAGKRVCPGKAFAIIQVHIIIATILQRFNLTLAKEATEDLDKVFRAPFDGIVFRVAPYKICAMERSLGETE